MCDEFEIKQQLLVEMQPVRQTGCASSIVNDWQIAPYPTLTLMLKTASFAWMTFRSVNMATGLNLAVAFL